MFSKLTCATTNSFFLSIILVIILVGLVKIHPLKSSLYKFMNENDKCFLPRAKKIMFFQHNLVETLGVIIDYLLLACNYLIIIIVHQAQPHFHFRDLKIRKVRFTRQFPKYFRFWPEKAGSSSSYFFVEITECQKCAKQCKFMLIKLNKFDSNINFLNFLSSKTKFSFSF